MVVFKVRDSVPSRVIRPYVLRQWKTSLIQLYDNYAYTQHILIIMRETQELGLIRDIPRSDGAHFN